MQVWVFPDNGINVGFVNGAECSRGTHIRAVRNEINNAISAYLLSKEKIDITPKNVDGKYSMFCTFHVNNPSYDSQTKECLTTVVEKFSNDSKYTFKVPEAFIKNVLKSEIVDIVIDWYKQNVKLKIRKHFENLIGKQRLRLEITINSLMQIQNEQQIENFGYLRVILPVQDSEEHVTHKHKLHIC